jgi:hypothetical protein
MIMHWPQITIIVIAAIELGIHVANDGKMKIEKYSGWMQLILISFEMWLLYCGGFFG